jgi:hypothetical protein
MTEYKETPYFSNNKIRRVFDKLDMSFSSEGRKKNEV